MASIYTPGKLIGKCRTLANDKIGPPFFVTDEEYLDFLSQRQREAAVEQLLLRSAGVYSVQAVAMSPWVTPLENMLKIDRLVRNDGGLVEPVPFSVADDAQRCRQYSGFSLPSDWRSRTGTPQWVITDMTEDRWRLAPIPTEDMLLGYEGYVVPQPVTSVTDTVELPDEYAQHLHLGMLADAFNVEDEDAMYDPNKALEYLNRWEAAKLGMGMAYERNRRHGGRAVRYGGL